MILIVDDDATIRLSLSALMRRAGYACRTAANPTDAMDAVREKAPDVVLLDMNFTSGTSGEDGLTLMRQIRIFAPEAAVILITAWGSIELAVKGMRQGAFDFQTKPWDNKVLLERVTTALQMKQKGFDTTDNNSFDRGEIIGTDAALTDTLRTIARVAPTSAPVLITGESGTGKELIAEVIHRNSRRAAGPFVKVNLGGIAPSLFESEMFGHKKGAFTGAIADRIGRFEAADKGTIFLDEIGELDLACQVKLLRVLQEMQFEPLGSSRTRTVDVRVVCATNADLPGMVANRSFREDLFYRINLITVSLPALRHRPGDIEALSRRFADMACERNGIRRRTLTSDGLAYLKSLPFPGNIRELKNMVERACLLSESNELTADDFRQISPDKSPQKGGSLEEMERGRIEEVLAAHHGNVSRAARELGVSRAALYRRIEKYGIDI